jgi:hypothetical protein
MELAEQRVLTEGRRRQVIPVDREADPGRQRLLQLALGPLDLHRPRLDVDLDALRNSDWFLADT